MQVHKERRYYSHEYTDQISVNSLSQFEALCVGLYDQSALMFVIKNCT